MGIKLFFHFWYSQGYSLTSVCILGLLGNCLTCIVLAQYQVCQASFWCNIFHHDNNNHCTDFLNIFKTVDWVSYDWLSAPPCVPPWLRSSLPVWPALMVLVCRAIYPSYKGRNTDGVIFFRHLFFVQHITITGSIYGVIIIALERHRVIRYPLRTTPTFAICSTFLALFSISVNLPKFLEFKVLIILNYSHFQITFLCKDFSWEGNNSSNNDPSGRKQNLHEMEQLLGPADTSWSHSFPCLGNC